MYPARSLGSSGGGGRAIRRPTRRDVTLDEVSRVARHIMRTADTNRNGELSYTELTSMLGGSPYQDFGKWLHEQGQAAFRKYDDDRQGSINAKELEPAVRDFLAGNSGGGDIIASNGRAHKYEASVKVMITASMRHEGLVAKQAARNSLAEADSRRRVQRKREDLEAKLENARRKIAAEEGNRQRRADAIAAKKRAQKQRSPKRNEKGGQKKKRRSSVDLTTLEAKLSFVRSRAQEAAESDSSIDSNQEGRGGVEPSWKAVGGEGEEPRVIRGRLLSATPARARARCEEVVLPPNE